MSRLNPAAVLLLSLCSCSLWAQSMQTPEAASLSAESHAFQMYAQGTPWQQVAAKSGSKDVFFRIGIISEPRPGIPGFKPKINTLDYDLAEDMRESNAVVVVSFTSADSHLTAGQDFVFSDFHGVVEQVLKDEGDTLNPGSRITVSRGGGTVRIDGHTISGVVTNFPPYLLHTRYLLLLNKIPGSSSYLGWDSGSFGLTNSQVYPGSISSNFEHSYSPKQEDSFLREMKRYIVQQHSDAVHAQEAK